MAALALLLPASPSWAESSEAGWIAEFVWSPHYCSRFHDAREAHEPQCTAVNGFVLQRLQQQTAGANAADCKRGGPMSGAIVDQMVQFTRNRVETQRAWLRHGRCSGLSEADYAAYAEHVDRRMSWPAHHPSKDREALTKPEAVLADIVRDNPGLATAAIAVRCQKRQIASILLCLDARFEPSAACVLPDNCPDRVSLRHGR